MKTIELRRTPTGPGYWPAPLTDTLSLAAYVVMGEPTTPHGTITTAIDATWTLCEDCVFVVVPRATREAAEPKVRRSP